MYNFGVALSVSNIITLVGWIITPVLGMIIGWIRTTYINYKKKIEEQSTKNEEEKEILWSTVRVVLRESIKNEYLRRRPTNENAGYEDVGWCPLERKAELKEEYELYVKMKGNHTVPLMYEYLMNLPEDKEHAER